MNNDNKRPNIFVRIWRFYIDGFRSMTLGKTLWTIILIKLFVMFFIIKLFFFPISSTATTTTMPTAPKP